MESLVVIWLELMMIPWCQCQILVRSQVIWSFCLIIWSLSPFLLPIFYLRSLPRILQRRTNPKVKARVTSFLENVNAESIIQLAMLCDAAQEELELSLVSKLCHLSLMFWLALRQSCDGRRECCIHCHLKDPFLWQEHGGRSPTPFWNGWLLEQDLGFVPSKESWAYPFLHSPCFSSSKVSVWKVWNFGSLTTCELLFLNFTYPGK